ncbi:MAG TPA: ABC transporter substrate-binding protein [Dehalococcoidia bacterium]|nr:ABC transporter substrate-binding protein [Dehalococcoidia bacterium]
MSGYWERMTKSRLSRRRALGGAAVAGAGAIALGVAGCGGGGESGTAGGDASGLLSQPVDSTSRAKPGGAVRDFRNEDITSMDALTNNSFTRTGVSNYVYPRLLKFKVAKAPHRASGENEGELADHYEITGDKLQLTFKLRQGLKWDPRSPTNGRPIDADDVVFSWDRFTRLSPLKGDILYSESSPGVPVMSLKATDKSTVVAQLHHPDAAVLHLFASSVILPIMPREADGGFDPRGTARGYGPWMLSDYRPSQGLTFTKNPDYHVKGRPFPDSWEVAIVPEYATRLAQFKAGNIWTTVVTQDDVIQAKKDQPQTSLRQDDVYSSGGTTIAFGYDNNSIFRDKRLRQAVSMLIDREAIIDVVGNRQKFAADGLDVAARTSGLVTPGFDFFWVDPRDEKKFGPNAKYLNYNPAEAKKLMSAAGYNGAEVDFNYRADGYSATYLRLHAITLGMLKEGGFNVVAKPREYQTDFLPNYHFAYVQGEKKGFAGLNLRAETAYTSLGTWLYSLLNPTASRYMGATDIGDARKGDATLIKMIDDLRGEFDLDKQKQIARKLDEYLADAAYGIPVTAYTLNFALYWPVLGNVGAFRGYTQGAPPVHERLEWWVDTEAAPLKS